MIFGAWFFFSVAAGLFAHVRRNRNGIGWFFVALFFSPVVAWVLLAILPEGECRAWVDPAIRQERINYQMRAATVVIFTAIAIFATATALGLVGSPSKSDYGFDQKMQTELARRNASH